MIVTMGAMIERVDTEAARRVGEGAGGGAEESGSEGEVVILGVLTA
jgi:hypothetical protein